MNPKSEPYRFVECPNTECNLRFPGVPGIGCPMCKSVTTLVGDRCIATPAGEETRLLPLQLLLDNVRSVFNVGSIFRTADGCGVDHIYLAGITPTPKHPAMRKTALGATDDISWSAHRNGVHLARGLKTAGHELWALERTQGSSNVLRFPRTDTITPILVLGNEVTGIDPDILQMCERTFHIPMTGNKVSLNVSTAMGVAAYMLTQYSSE